jgi:hypothetical protein
MFLQLIEVLQAIAKLLLRVRLRQKAKIPENSGFAFCILERFKLCQGYLDTPEATRHSPLFNEIESSEFERHLRLAKITD